MKRNLPTAPCPPRRSAAALLSLGCATLLSLLPVVGATADGEIAAVCSRTSDDYVRTKLATGAYAAEYYAFGPGGHTIGESPDATIDRLHFMDIARTLSGPLADQNYQPARDPAKTKLLIMVYWGTTTGSTDNQNTLTARTIDEKIMSRSERDRMDRQNARLLGYDATNMIGTDYGRGLMATAFRLRETDLLDEIGDNRYFVILMAYDFQLLWKEKKSKLLWETRFSLREHRNDFAEALPAMALDASRYFGQATRGLVRKPLRDPKIELGDLKSLGLDGGKN